MLEMLPFVTVLDFILRHCFPFRPWVHFHWLVRCHSSTWSTNHLFKVTIWGKLIIANIVIINTDRILNTYIALRTFCTFGSSGSRSPKMCGLLWRIVYPWTKIFLAYSRSPFVEWIYRFSKRGSKTSGYKVKTGKQTKNIVRNRCWKF